MSEEAGVVKQIRASALFKNTPISETDDARLLSATRFCVFSVSIIAPLTGVRVRFPGGFQISTSFSPAFFFL